MFHIIWSVIAGFFVGLIARAVVPGADHMGFILTTVLGIAGSVAGGFIGGLIKKPEPGTRFHPAGFFMSIVGAVVLLLVVVVDAILGFVPGAVAAVLAAHCGQDARSAQFLADCVLNAALDADDHRPDDDTTVVVLRTFDRNVWLFIGYWAILGFAYSLIQVGPGWQRLRFEVCIKKAEPFLALPYKVPL